MPTPPNNHGRNGRNGTPRAEDQPGAIGRKDLGRKDPGREDPGREDSGGEDPGPGYILDFHGTALDHALAPPWPADVLPGAAPEGPERSPVNGRVNGEANGTSRGPGNGVGSDEANPWLRTMPDVRRAMRGAASNREPIAPDPLPANGSRPRPSETNESADDVGPGTGTSLARRPTRTSPAALPGSVPVITAGQTAGGASPGSGVHTSVVKATPPLRPSDSLIDYEVVRRVRRQVSELLAGRLRDDPDLDEDAQRELSRSLLVEPVALAGREHAHRTGRAWPPGTDQVVGDAVIAALFGMGRFQPLLDDDRVENIEVSGADQVWVCYADGTEVQVGPVADSDQELIELLQLVAARRGGSERSFTTATPSLDARLEDGSRLAAMAWVTPRPQVVIRRHRARDVTLADLVRWGSIDTVLAAFLGASLRAGRNIVVTGLQNAGKTTLLRAIASEFSPMERFGTIEREYELLLHELPRHPRVFPMEAREGSSERDAAGRRAGEVTVEELVRRALRFNLRRIIVGEVRDSAVLPMLDAMITGDGSLCTLHARSGAHAVDRLVTLCTAAGISDTFAYRLVAGAVDLVVHIDLVDERWTGGQRYRHVSDVIELNGIGEGSRPTTTTVFAPGPDGRAVPAHRPVCLPDLVRAGFDPTLLDHPAGTWRRASQAGARSEHGDRARDGGRR